MCFLKNYSEAIKINKYIYDHYGKKLFFIMIYLNYIKNYLKNTAMNIEKLEQSQDLSGTAIFSIVIYCFKILQYLHFHEFKHFIVRISLS